MRLMDCRRTLDYDSLKSFLVGTGLLPYDIEIISFLRRFDRNDDGVISENEVKVLLDNFGEPSSSRPIKLD